MQSLPPWVQQYCPDDCDLTGQAAPDRRTEPEFVYCPAPSIREWQEPNERIFEESQNGPRPWEL